MKREAIPYRATNQIFLQKDKNYIQQYSHIYLKRLLSFRELLQKKIAEQAKVVDRVIDLRVGDYVGVIGTIYKEQKLKPCVLDEFSNDFGINIRENLENYCGPDDFLLLEDESGRCNLVGEKIEWEEQISTTVTGVVVACIGTLNETGDFVVSKLMFPGEVIPRTINPPPQSWRDRPRYLLLSSDLRVGATSENYSTSLQLLLEYIAGTLNPEIGSSICRFVIAGGALINPLAVKDINIDSKITSESQEQLADPIRVADRYFAELASLLPVDLMPGAFDPSNTSLPQQPLHHCLFPNAARFTTFKRATNPHSFVLDKDFSVLGTSGQPIIDALHYVKPGLTPLSLLETMLLRYRHLAPTAPDTLACYPFFDRDPFVLDQKADANLFFAGGLNAFETSFLQGTRFVCIPSFFETKEVVLVDLSSEHLEATLVKFNVHL